MIKLIAMFIYIKLKIVVKRNNDIFYNMEYLKFSMHTCDDAAKCRCIYEIFQ